MGPRPGVGFRPPPSRPCALDRPPAAHPSGPCQRCGLAGLPLPSFPSSVLRQAPAQVLHCSASVPNFHDIPPRRKLLRHPLRRFIRRSLRATCPSHGSPPHLVSQTYFPHLPPLARAAPNTRPAARLTAPVSAVPPRRANRHTRRRGFGLHYPWHQGLALRAHPRAHPSGDSHRAHPSGAPQTCGHPRSHPSGDSQEHPPLAPHPHFGVLVSLIHAPRRLRGPSSAFGRLRTSFTSAISSDCESSGLSPLLLMIRQSRLCVSSPLTPLTPT